MASLLASRHAHLVPRLHGIVPGAAYRCEGDLLRIEWILGDGKPWLMLVNLAQTATETDPLPEGTTVFAMGDQGESADGRWRLAPNAVRVVLVGPTDTLEASA